MLDVCSSGRTCPERVQSSRAGSTYQGSGARRIDSPVAICATPRWSSKYQKPVRNPYALLPRPPQTQAAHFKRLTYLKMTPTLDRQAMLWATPTNPTTVSHFDVGERNELAAAGVVGDGWQVSTMSGMLAAVLRRRGFERGDIRGGPGCRVSSRARSPSLNRSREAGSNRRVQDATNFRSQFFRAKRLLDIRQTAGQRVPVGNQICCVTRHQYRPEFRAQVPQFL